MRRRRPDKQRWTLHRMLHQRARWSATSFLLRTGEAASICFSSWAPNQEIRRYKLRLRVQQRQETESPKCCVRAAERTTWHRDGTMSPPATNTETHLPRCNQSVLRSAAEVLP